MRGWEGEEGKGEMKPLIFDWIEKVEVEQGRLGVVVVVTVGWAEGDEREGGSVGEEMCERRG